MKSIISKCGPSAAADVTGASCFIVDVLIRLRFNFRWLGGPHIKSQPIYFKSSIGSLIMMMNQPQIIGFWSPNLPSLCSSLTNHLIYRADCHPFILPCNFHFRTHFTRNFTSEHLSKLAMKAFIQLANNSSLIFLYFHHFFKFMNLYSAPCSNLWT